MKRLIKLIGKCKLYYDSEYSEYSVAVTGKPDSYTYYTDDKEDAVVTAIMMNEDKTNV